jgi:translation initiation factor 3 subunit D
VNPKDSYNHTILGLQSYKPTEFANQINLNIRNMWGILKGVIDTCMQLPEGKFLLLKDPNKAMISLYAVPQDAFDDLDDDTEASDELIEDEAELEEDETDDENYA